jgi:hypothetical protein
MLIKCSSSRRIFVGTKAIIVKFNYDEVFKKVKEELLKEQED